METRFKVLSVLSLILIATLALPRSARAAEVYDDQVIFGGNFTLQSGDVIEGNLVVFGGNVELETDSLVNGDVVVFGGNVDADGEVNGDLLVIGGHANLMGNALIRGDLITPGGTVDRADGARVEGQVITDSEILFRIGIPGTRILTPRVPVPGFSFNFNPVFQLLSLLFRTFSLAALAVLLVMFLPQQAERAAQAAASQPLIAGGLGLLTVIVLPPLLIVLTIASLLLLTPVSLLGFLLLGLAVLFGWIAMGLEVGNRLAGMFNQHWPAALSAGIGTFLLTFVISSIGLIPCLGFLAGILIASLGLGAVILSRFGTQEYPLAATMAAPPDPEVGPGTEATLEEQ